MPFWVKLLNVSYCGCWANLKMFRFLVFPVRLLWGCPLLTICHWFYHMLMLSLQFVHFLTSWPSRRTPLRSDWWSMATLCTQRWSQSYSWLLHGSVWLTANTISCPCPDFVNNVHRIYFIVFRRWKDEMHGVCTYNTLGFTIARALIVFSVLEGPTLRYRSSCLSSLISINLYYPGGKYGWQSAWLQSNNTLTIHTHRLFNTDHNAPVP